MSTASKARPANVAVDGQTVRRLRQDAGHTVTELARLATISYSYVSQIENERRGTVSPRVAHKIAGALGVPLHRIRRREAVAA